MSDPKDLYSREPQLFAEQHEDPYVSELGPGVPIYDEWVIEEDGSSDFLRAEATEVADEVNDLLQSSTTEAMRRNHMNQQRQRQQGDAHGGSASAGTDAAVGSTGGPGGVDRLSQAARRQVSGFKTPAGRPSTNELWRFRDRGCQDCWAALFFFGLVFVIILWGLIDIHYFELTPDMLEMIVRNTQPSTSAALIAAEGADSGMTVPQKALAGLEALPSPALANALRDMDRVLRANNDEIPGSVRGVRAMAAGLMAIWRVQTDKNGSEDPQQVTQAIADAVMPWRGTLRSIAITTFWVLVWVVVSFLASLVALVVLQWMPLQLIVAECWTSSIVMTGVAMTTMFHGQLMYGMLLLGCASMPLLWLYLIRDRMPFACALLSTAANILRHHKGLAVLSVLLAFLSILFAVFCAFLLLIPVLHALAGVGTARDGLYALAVCFAVFWVQQVMENVMHVTACGVVATWYFAGGNAHMPSSPIRASFRRATTTSIGSICFGSLIVAVIRFLRFVSNVARNAGDNNGQDFFGCVCDCFLRCLEAVVQYFNLYAFVHVAVYGSGYIESAKKTWALTTQCFFSAFFNDALAEQAVDILGLFASFAVAFVAGIVMWSFWFAVLVFLLASLITATVLQIVESSVTTLFVCFAEVPEGLAVSFPALFAALVRADGGYTRVGLTGGEPVKSYGAV